MISPDDPHGDLRDAGAASPLVATPPHSFIGAPQCHDLDFFDHEVALLGVPYDQGYLFAARTTAAAESAAQATVGA